MGRAFLAICAVSILVFAVVMAIPIRDADEPADAPQAPGAGSDERPAPLVAPRLETRTERASEIPEGTADDDGIRNVIVLSNEDDRPVEGAIVEGWSSSDGRGGVLLGKVLTPSGEPAAAAWVSVVPTLEDPYDRDHDETRTSVTCDARGCFRLHLQVGSCTVTAYDADHRARGTARVDVSAGGRSRVEVHLK